MTSTQAAKLPALPLEGGKASIVRIGQLSETPLWKLLTDVGNSSYAIEQIGRSPALRQHATQVVDSLERLSRGLDRSPESAEAIVDIMEPLFAMFGRPKKRDADLADWWDMYFQALEGVPRLALDEAIGEAIKTRTIHSVPLPAELRKLAEPVTLKIRMAAYRARAALKVQVRQPIPLEDRQAVAQGLRDLSRRLGGDSVAGSLYGAPQRSQADEAARLRPVHR